MRRVFQKGIAVALAAAMVITAAPAGQAGAAKKASMAKKASVAVGKTVTIKIKNSSKKAKVSWKTSSKKVAKITKQVKKGAKASAKVKGVKKGTAKITATYKVGKKSQKFVCKVTVKKAETKVTTPSATPSTKPATATPANTSTAAPTNPVNDGPTTEPTVEPTKGPTATPRPSATPSPAPKNTSLDATKLGDADAITVDGTVDKAEWENAGKEQNLLVNNMSVRGKLTEGTTATAQIAWTDTAVYVGIKSSAEMSEAKFFIDEDGDTANANAKSATATLSSDKKQAEAKIDLAAAPDMEKGLKAEIQLKIGDATVNFFDSVTEIEYNKDKDEWNFKDNGIKAGTDDSVLGTLNLLPSMAQATSAYFTDKQAEILAEAKIPEGDDTFEQIAEGAGWTTQRTKTMTFVDPKYWTDAYEANGSSSIYFTNVNIPDWQGNADKVGLATEVLNDEGASKDPREFVSSRENAQGYIIWDKQYLYVLFDINDSDISPANSDHYTTDSTEFFLDEDYSQPGSYTEDGSSDEVQLRIDAADGAFSSNGAGTGNYQLVAHAVNYKKDADDKTTGYQVEYIIKLNKEHSNGYIMGMDLQINDCYTTYTYVKDADGNDTEEIDTTVDPTASRAATLTAYDTTNNDYQYPNCFGRVKLINKDEAEPDKPGETDPPTVTDPPAETDEYHVDITKFKTNGKVTATVNEDGSVTLEWPEDAPDWANIECIFDEPKDLSKYTNYIVKTKNGETLFCANILDATKKSQWGARASVGIKYGFETNKATTLASLLNSDYNGDNEGGTDADYTNVAGVSFNKNAEAKAVSTTITDIIFY